MCVRDLSACIYTQGTLVYSLIWRTFVESAQNLTGEIAGRVESLTHKGHPSIWWPRSIILNFGFPERVHMLCTTDSSCLCFQTSFSWFSSPLSLNWSYWSFCYYLWYNKMVKYNEMTDNVNSIGKWRFTWEREQQTKLPTDQSENLHHIILITYECKFRAPVENKTICVFICKVRIC